MPALDFKFKAQPCKCMLCLLATLIICYESGVARMSQPPPTDLPEHALTGASSAVGPCGRASPQGWIFLLLGLGAILGVFVLHRFDPRTYTFYPRCQFHQFTGLHCPGCGSQRALHALVHGDMTRAFQHNALLIVGAPVLGVWWLKRRLRERTDGPPSLPGAKRRHRVWLLVGVVALFTVARNLPWEPFTWLAP